MRLHGVEFALSGGGLSAVGGPIVEQRQGSLPVGGRHVTTYPGGLGGQEIEHDLLRRVALDYESQTISVVESVILVALPVESDGFFVVGKRFRLVDDSQSLFAGAPAEVYVFVIKRKVF